MSWLLSLATRLSIPQAYRRDVAYMAIALAVVATLLMLSRCHDRRVIAAHDAKTAAATAAADRKADASAATRRRADDARQSADTTELKRITDNAPTSPVSDARRAYLECVRRQQAARGGQSPAC